MKRLDIVTVFHNELNYRQYLQLVDTVRRWEPDGGYTFFGVDNRVNNRGFSVACNLGARHPRGQAPVIGFLNPDCEVNGPFIAPVQDVLEDSRTVITGCRYGKPQLELREWGVSDWVCGATMFVKRAWFHAVGGFDEQFVWSHEESDLIRRAETQGLCCRPVDLPITHESPRADTAQDADYKRFHFARAQKRYHAKWGRGHGGQLQA